MTRQELENELIAYRWIKKFNGTHSALWQSGHEYIDVSDKGVEIGTSGGRLCPRLPWHMINIEDRKMKVKWEVEL